MASSRARSGARHPSDTPVPPPTTSTAPTALTCTPPRNLAAAPATTDPRAASPYPGPDRPIRARPVELPAPRRLTNRIAAPPVTSSGRTLAEASRVATTRRAGRGGSNDWVWTSNSGTPRRLSSHRPASRAPPPRRHDTGSTSVRPDLSKSSVGWRRVPSWTRCSAVRVPGDPNGARGPANGHRPPIGDATRPGWRCADPGLASGTRAEVPLKSSSPGTADLPVPASEPDRELRGRSRRSVVPQVDKPASTTSSVASRMRHLVAAASRRWPTASGG